MNSQSPPESAVGAAAAPAGAGSLLKRGVAPAPRVLVLLLALLVVVALVANGLLWQKLSNIQELLARRSSEASAQSTEARTLARQAQGLARETAARQAVADARWSEATLQRTQLEELMQSLSRSRDENLVIDIESSVRLAQQQAQLTLSVEPLMAALKTADERVVRAAHPRLAPLRRAIGRDLERIKVAQVTDTLGLLGKLDDLVRQVDELPLANAMLPVAAVGSARVAVETPAAEWWMRGIDIVRAEAGKLLRVSRIDQPEAALLAPEQSFFLRENLKLKLLNARLGLLARQLESARTDLASASLAMNKYFEPASRKTQAAVGLLSQVQSQMKTVELPRVDETLTALATAAAGR